MAIVTAHEPPPAPPADGRLDRLTERFGELRNCQARYADFTLGLFDRFDRLAHDWAAKKLDTDQAQADHRRELAERYQLENQQALAEMESLRRRLAEVEGELQSTQAALEQERQCTASEKVALDEETREFLDDLVQQRDALRAELEATQLLIEEQKAGYASELELLRNELRDANRQVAKLRERSDSAVAVGAQPKDSADIRGDVSRRAEDFQAPCDTAETSPNPCLLQPLANRDSPSGGDLASLMNQVRLLQQDVARRRGAR